MESLCVGLRERFGDRAQLGLQTNGVLVDDGWIGLFAKYGLGVSVSIDGPPDLHDANRPDARGRGSHDRAVVGLRRLQAASEAGRIPPPGVLAVYNPCLTGAEYFDYFVNELGVRGFDLLFPDDLDDRFSDADSVLAAFEQANNEIWDRWLSRDDPRLRVRFIDQALRAVAFQRPAVFDPDNNSALVVDMSGDCFVEDGLRAVIPHNELKIGNWRKEPLDQVFERMSGFAENLKVMAPVCQACTHLSICKGGDFTLRYDVATKRFGQSRICNVYKANFEHAYKVIEGVRRLAPAGVSE
jgi:uncharacterized protein